MQMVLGHEHDAAVACRQLRELANEPHAFLEGELAALENAARLGARAKWHKAWRKAKRAFRRVGG